MESLKEFQNILRGQELIIHTDHENLSYKKFNSDCAMQWQLFSKEYSPNLCYIEGENNIVTDDLSQLELWCEPMEEAHFTEELCSSLYCHAKEEITLSEYPLSYAALSASQAKEKQILKVRQKKDSLCVLKSFHGGGTSRELIFHRDKIVEPASQQVRTINNWYHNYLCHLGINRTEETIGQHLWWPNMRKHIMLSVSTCKNCHWNKHRHRKYGNLPEKEAEAMP
jgi:hypothetical protein